MSFSYIIYIVAALAIGGAVVFYQNMRMSAGKNDFLAQYPDASKVLLASKNFLIVQENIGVATVNDEQPVLFSENLIKGGFYAKPGSNKVQMIYSHTRPGIMHKTVTTTYGPTERELKVEPNKTYRLSFDRKAEDFVFEEV
jgi:hypothetical protein